jgi:hypothetical protein
MTTTTGRLAAARTAPDNAASAGPAAGQHQQATQHAADANSSHLHFRVGDSTVDVTLPPLDKLAFYAGLGGAVAFGLIEWPIAALTGLGHLLTDDRRNRTLRALGEALDAA